MLLLVFFFFFSTAHSFSRYFSSAVNKLPTLRFNAHTSVQCFGRITFPQNKKKLSNREKKNALQRPKQFFFLYILSSFFAMENSDFPLILANQPITDWNFNYKMLFSWNHLNFFFLSFTGHSLRSAAVAALLQLSCRSN